MTDYIPKSANGAAPFTLKTSGVVAQGTLVTVSGTSTVAASTTGGHSIGVAGHDAASGALLTIWPLHNVIHVTQIQDSQTLAGNSPVIAGTTGFVSTGTLATVAAAGTLLGVCIAGATGSDSTPTYATWIGTT